MRIVFFGDMNTYGRTFQRCRALKELGHDVDELSFVPLGHQPGVSRGPGLLYRVMNKFGYPSDATGLNKALPGNGRWPDRHRATQPIHARTRCDIGPYEKQLLARG